MAISNKYCSVAKEPLQLILHKEYPTLLKSRTLNFEKKNIFPFTLACYHCVATVLHRQRTVRPTLRQLKGLKNCISSVSKLVSWLINNVITHKAHNVPCGITEITGIPDLGDFV